MRIAFLSQNACTGDAIGGQLAGKVAAAQDAGHEVRVYLSEAARLRPEVEAVAVVASPRDLWRSAHERDFLLGADAVVVEYGGDFPLLDLLPALRRRGRRILFCYRGVTPPEFWPAADQPRLRRAAARRDWVWFADEAIADSSAAAEELHADTGYPRERLRTLPCFLQPLAAGAVDVRKKLGAGAAPVVLFVGRLAANKDLPTLLRALSLLKDRMVRVVAVGPKDDLYAAEAERCQALARELGVADRLHLLGSLPNEELASWYAQADVLALPSRHECFGLPVLEAAAAGLPVVAAAAGSLPETLGSAGLAFRPGDAADLARQLERVLGGAAASPLSAPAAARIAVISPRYGADFAGGAEQSLRRMARALAERGHAVEIFATCNRHDSRWANHLPAGTTELDGLPVHRFPIDAFDPNVLAKACEEIQRRSGDVPPQVVQAYLAHSLGSTALLEALAAREQEFSAFLAGPYLFKLTCQAARRFGERLLLAPCFHDEPYAFLDELRRTYANVGGFLFHTEAEMEFAQRRLGLCHPRSYVVGTLLPPAASAPAAPPPQRLAAEPYFVYCGRFCPEKGLDRLLDWSARTAAADPTFRLVLLGHGAMPLPRAPWLTNLGFVDEATKRDAIAGARALINLSPNESLSIVLLEAWAQGVPVIGFAGCAVVKRQIERAAGGFAVDGYESFRAAVAALSADAKLRARLGEQGRRFTAERYQDPEAYAARLERAVRELHEPLRERMRRAGRERAAAFALEAWKPKFLALLARQPHRARSKPKLAIRPAAPLRAGQGQSQILAAFRVRSSEPISSVGLGRRALWTQLFRASGAAAARPTATPLPKLLVPGQELLATAAIRVPPEPGAYRLAVAFGPPGKPPKLRPRFPFQVAESGAAADDVSASFLEAAKAALAETHRQRTLPTEYADVTQGFLAPLKAWVKQKVLHNFRKAYMEPLARQQSAVNEGLLTALCRLTEAAAAQAGAAQAARAPAEAGDDAKRLRRRIRRLEAAVAELAKAIAALAEAKPNETNRVEAYRVRAALMEKAKP